MSNNLRRIGAVVHAVGREEYAADLRAGDQTEQAIAEELRRLDPALPDFYFVLFADLADGRRITSDGLGRWYIGALAATEIGADPAAAIVTAVREEIELERDDPGRWSVLELALRRTGTTVEAAQLDEAPFVVELDSSAREYLTHATRGDGRF